MKINGGKSHYDKINDLKFLDNDKELSIIINKTIKYKLINELEKDLKTVIRYKKSNIKSIIGYNSFIKVFTHKIDNSDEEKLSLMSVSLNIYFKIL